MAAAQFSSKGMVSMRQNTFLSGASISKSVSKQSRKASMSAQAKVNQVPNFSCDPSNDQEHGMWYITGFINAWQQSIFTRLTATLVKWVFALVFTSVSIRLERIEACDWIYRDTQIEIALLIQPHMRSIVSWAWRTRSKSFSSHNHFLTSTLSGWRDKWLGMVVWSSYTGIDIVNLI